MYTPFKILGSSEAELRHVRPTGIERAEVAEKIDDTTFENEIDERAKIRASADRA
jgi:hypothetical protein